MIPILDFQQFLSGDKSAFVTDIGQACREVGFAMLRGHGVDPKMISGVFDATHKFFALDVGEKDRLSIYNSKHDRGYAPFGSERLDEQTGLIDRKEAFNVGLDLSPDDPRVVAGEPFRGVNQWPDIPGFRETLMGYYNAMWALGIEVHRALALDLGLQEHWFRPHLDQPMAILRLLHYPPATGADNELGAGAHSDYGSISLLATDGVPGLQVRPRGKDWIDVPFVEGAFVINIGDCLMRWTNDIYVSTPHRVIAPKRDRYSVAFFFDPNPDTLVSALPGTGDVAKYPPVLASDYLAERLAATYE
ncbi:MAG: 2-oxoglutarate and iron-dependent oxygenase domain-containing protein [Pseudomonadota bacterium]